MTTRPRNLCLLSGAHPSRNPRLVKEADALAGAGYAVRVLTLATHAPALAHDTELARHARWSLHYAADLTREGLRWRLRTRLARVAVRRGGWNLPSALGAVYPLLHAAAATPADLTIAHTEPALWVARELARRGRGVAVDLEDWHSEDLLPADRRHRPVGLLAELERDHLHRAGYVSVPSRAMAEALQARFGGSSALVLRNVFPLGPRAETRRRNGRRLVWFSQTIGPGRGLEAFLEAWARMQMRTTLDLIGHAPAAELLRLLALLPPEARTRLHFIGSVAPRELPHRLREYDVGLALENASPPSRDLTITNKVFQYLEAGLAVIATPTRGQREAAAAAPEAIHLLPDAADPNLIASELDRYLDDPTAVLARGQAARQAAEARNCWERESPRLLAAVAAALAGERAR